MKLADHLEAMALRANAATTQTLHMATQAARERSTGFAREPLGPSPMLKNGVPAEVSNRAVPLCELLLDCYLDYGERLRGEHERTRAQEFAAGAVECRSVIRSALT